jgi:hypothetical protein
MGIDKALLSRRALNYASAPVEPRVLDLFRFAEKFTRHPADMEKADVDRVREACGDDAAILETVLMVSLYACANRFSAGVGLVADFSLHIDDDSLHFFRELQRHLSWQERPDPNPRPFKAGFEIGIALRAPFT